MSCSIRSGRVVVLGTKEKKKIYALRKKLKLTALDLLASTSDS